MKNKILNLTLLFFLSTALLVSCNSNNSNSNYTDSSMNSNKETSPGMDTVQTDTTDTIHTHSGMHENNSEVKK